MNDFILLTLRIQIHRSESEGERERDNSKADKKEDSEQRGKEIEQLEQYSYIT